MKRAILLACAAAALLLMAVAAWLAWSPRQVPAGQPPLHTLRAHSLPAFRAAFNGGRGEVRILALLSPT